jgi:SAM-dependent methyltransferase
MAPYGEALRAFYGGEREATILVRRDDGLELPLPVSHFFRAESEFTRLERLALGACRGPVLDVGAGTGIHSLALQTRGVEVRALDISPVAVEIMARRGVKEVCCQDVLLYQDGPFRTLLLLGHGVGMTGDLSGLGRFLVRATSLLGEEGCLLLDSVDVSRSIDPRHRSYQEANRRAGRYVGETRIQFEFEGRRGPFLPWLHVTPETLRERALSSGLRLDVLAEGEGGEYLARLSRPVTGARRWS